MKVYDFVADLSWALGLAERRHHDPDLRPLLQALPRGGTAVDVGANRGLYSVGMARQVGARGRVLAIEPCVENLRTLHLQQKLRRLYNLEIYACALGDCNGLGYLQQPTTVSGRRRTALGTVTAAPRQAQLERCQKVVLRTLDNLADEIRLERLDVLKIDVEGAELAVLAGARRCLERWHPVLLIEAEEQHLARRGHSLMSLRKELCDLGYQVRPAHVGSPNLLAVPCT